MAEPRIKAPKEPPMRMAEEPPVVDVELEPEDADAVEPEEPNDPPLVMTMDSAPFDGTIIEVRAENEESAWHLAAHRITRQRVNGPDGRMVWKPISMWCDPMTRERLPFDPVFWRQRQTEILPGMVLA